MTTYVIRRLIQASIVVVIVTWLVFLAMNALPGDPIYIYITRTEADLGALDKITPEQMAALRAQFGLDKPLHVQYVNWIGGLLRGQWGTSVYYKEDMAELLRQRLPVSLYFNIIAFFLTSLVGWPLGIIAALKRGTPWDSTIIAVSNLGLTIPSFWLGIMLIYVFGFKLGWLPIYGYTSPFENFGLSIKQLLMPLTCLTIGGFGGSARLMRSCMLEVLNQDYLRTARSKGLKERVIIMRHALKNSLILPITGKGMALANILSGSVLVETVFNIPGVGRLSVDAVFSKDYAIVMGVVLVGAVMLVLANLLVDITYGWLDPRIRLGRRGGV